MIGVFDSGYGGLTILQQIRERLPEYDYLYLGDNARAPYGTRSFECIYRYTLEAVRYMLDRGCTLIILACNTASAKALRTIQQHDLPRIREQRILLAQRAVFEQSGLYSLSEAVNVLGVIRPTVEVVPSMTHSGHVGVLATPATVSSESYVLELEKISNLQIFHGSADRQKSSNPPLVVTQQACPMWVPLIEAGEHQSAGAEYFIRLYLEQILERDPLIDTLVLGCTHYPLIQPQIDAVLREIAAERELPPCRTIAQGTIVARSLEDYLRRHNEYTSRLTQGGTCTYLTTDDAARFADSAAIFLGQPVQATHVDY